MSKDKDSNFWQKYEAKRKEEAAQTQKGRGKSLDKDATSKGVSSNEVLKKEESQFKNIKKEVGAKINPERTLEPEKTNDIKVKSTVDPNKSIKPPIKQSEFDQSTWKKNQEEKQKAIDDKVTKSPGATAKSPLKSKLEQVFGKREEKSQVTKEVKNEAQKNVKPNPLKEQIQKRIPQINKTGPKNPPTKGRSK
jgi:predicted component of type VI protein secretion system